MHPLIAHALDITAVASLVRRRGRQKSAVKEAVSLRLDADLVWALRESEPGPEEPRQRHAAKGNAGKSWLRNTCHSVLPQIDDAEKDSRPLPVLPLGLGHPACAAPADPMPARSGFERLGRSYLHRELPSHLKGIGLTVLTKAVQRPLDNLVWSTTLSASLCGRKGKWRTPPCSRALLHPPTIYLDGERMVQNGWKRVRPAA